MGWFVVSFFYFGTILNRLFHLMNWGIIWMLGLEDTYWMWIFWGWDVLHTFVLRVASRWDECMVTFVIIYMFCFFHNLVGQRVRYLILFRVVLCSVVRNSAGVISFSYLSWAGTWAHGPACIKILFMLTAKRSSVMLLYNKQQSKMS